MKKIKIIFVESQYYVDMIQFAGRIRKGVDVVYVIDDASQYGNNYNKLEYEYAPTEIKSANEKLIELAEKHLTGWGEYNTKNWVMESNEIKIFVKFIERKFDFVRYNYFTNRFEVYHQKKRAINHLEDALYSYKDNILGHEEYIRRHTNVEDVRYDCKSKKNLDKERLDQYFIKNPQYIGQMINKETRDKILLCLTNLGIRNSKGQVYTKLKNLLNQYDYDVSIEGKSSNPKITIAKGKKW